MNEQVLPIKDTNVLNEVKHTLLHHFKYGLRNLTIFEVGVSTMLRASDLVKLKISDVFDNHGSVKRNAFTTDQKTGKHNTLFLAPCTKILAEYRSYLAKHQIHSSWLFPRTRDHAKHISTTQIYRIMQRTGKWLGLNYLGSHTMRKTGAYLVYNQTGNLALVMKLLNQSSEAVTLRYLGLNNPTIEEQLNRIDFNRI